MQHLLRTVFIPILLLLCFQLKSEQSSDTVLGRKIQSELYNLVLENEFQKIVDYVESVENNHPEFLGRWQNFHSILLTSSAEAYYSMEDYAGSMESDKKALKILENMERLDSSRIAQVLLNIVVSNIQLADFAQAEEYIFKTIEFVRGFVAGEEFLGELYHKYGTIKYHQSQFDSCIYYYDRVAEFYTNVTEDISRKWVVLYQGYSSAYRSLHQYNRAIYYDSLAVFKYENSEESTPVKLADTYNRFGISLEETGRINEAKDYYFRALDLLRNDSFARIELASTFQNLAYINFKQKDFGNAIDYFKEVIEIRQEKLGMNHPTTVDALSMTGLSYFELGDYKRSEEFYQKVIDLLPATYPEAHTKHALFYIKYAALKMEKGQLEEAYSLLKEAEHIFKRNHGEKNSYLIYVFDGLANYHYNKSHLEDAIAYQRKVLELALEYLESNNPRIARSYTKLAKYLREFGDHQSSFSELEKAYAQLNYVRDETDPKRIAYPLDLLSTLKESCLSYMASYERDGDDKSQQTALQISEELLDLFYYLRDQIDDYDSQIQLRSDVQEVFELLIEQYYQAFSQTASTDAVEQAFRLFELSKNYDLLVDFSRQSSNTGSGIPDSLLRIESDLDNKIEFIKLMMHDAGSEQRALNEQLIDAQNALDRLREKIKHDHPAYYENRYQKDIKSLKSIQSSLADDQIMLCYFIGEESLYQISLGSNTLDLIKLDYDEEFRGSVATVHSFLSSGRSIFESDAEELQSNSRSYCTHANRLYTLLLGSISQQLDKKKEIIVIPDAELALVPFEVLLSDTVNLYRSFSQFPYLIKDYSFIYQYAASFIGESGNSINSSSSYLGVAPSYLSQGDDISEYGRSEFGQLMFNVDEVRMISNNYESKLLLNEQATKQEFLLHSGDYDLLHLAAHGKANSSEGQLSFIAFSNVNDSLTNRLYAGELYQMKLNAALVVLSACETGSGQINENEGVLSVGRGFSGAGIRNAIMSLWNINDESSSRIFTSFYDELKTGNSLAASLQQAKLDQIGSSDSELMAHPFFWAAFVMYGDAATKNTTFFSSSQTTVFIGILVLLTFLFWFFFKKNN